MKNPTNNPVIITPPVGTVLNLDLFAKTSQPQGRAAVKIDEENAVRAVRSAVNHYLYS